MPFLGIAPMNGIFQQKQMSEVKKRVIRIQMNVTFVYKPHFFPSDDNPIPKLRQGLKS